MNHTRRNTIAIAIGLLLPVTGLWGHHDESPARSPTTAQAPALAADSTDDGPHVYWKSDSTAIVFYLCGGEVVRRDFHAVELLRFRGLCADSTIEYTIPAAAPAIPPFAIDGVSRILAVSDVHGEYRYLVDFLQAAGVIDDELRWSWGDGHLVVLGDVFDRGDVVTECLWLIYRLEREAKAAGGAVHLVLGNHEMMVVRGDLRYVNDKYISGIVRKTRIKYEDLYGPDMELGRWLRSKNAAIRLNGVLFVHGGLSPRLVERGMSLEELNEAARANLDIRSYELAFSDTAKFLYGSNGPFWYRGYHYAAEGRYRKATPQQIDIILQAYGATAVVVGHTGVDQAESLYDGKVYGIDVPVEELDSQQGLLWQDGQFSRVTGAGALEPLESLSEHRGAR